MASSDRARLLVAAALLTACQGSMSSTAPPETSSRDASTDASHDASASRDAAPGTDAVELDSGAAPDPRCPPHAIFCESFEDGAGVDLARWRVAADEGAFVIDDAL